MFTTRSWMLDARQLAAKLNVSIGSVRRWSRVGVIPAPVRLGRLLRWDPVAIEAFLKGAQP